MQLSVRRVAELLYILGVINLALLGILQYIGVADGLNAYKYIPHYDKIMHLVGGMVISIWALAYVSHSKNFIKKIVYQIGGATASSWTVKLLLYHKDLTQSSVRYITIVAVTFALFGGLIWELGQANSLIPHFSIYSNGIDTLLDLFFDGLGGVVSVGSVQLIKKVCAVAKYKEKKYLM